MNARGRDHVKKRSGKALKMKREFLKGIEGLTDEAIDKIMSEHGKDVESYKSKVKQYETDLATRESEIAKYKETVDALNAQSGNAEEIKKELETLKSSIEKEKADAEAKAKDEALTNNIIASFGDSKFTSEYVRNGIIADMKTEIAKDENQGKGYSEIFKALTENKTGIFENPNPANAPSPLGNPSGDPIEDKMRSIMGLKPQEK